MKKRSLLLIFSFFLSFYLVAQTRFSIATDVSLLRNFSPQQKFWAFGQTVETDFHFSKKNTLYAWINYHTKGSFINSFIAEAKSGSTSPQQVKYEVKGTWGFRQVSVGWKHFFNNSFNEASSITYYGAAGFGLLFSKIENALLTTIDTAAYSLRAIPGIGSDEFKRLTLDLAAGGEYSLAPNFFIYADLRTAIPTSDYPSPLLHNQKHVPLPLQLHIGIRVLFGTDDVE